MSYPLLCLPPPSSTTRKTSPLHCPPIPLPPQIYNPVKSAWDELSPQDVMQMMGRAGRPQFDSFGEGIIITGAAELQVCVCWGRGGEEMEVWGVSV